MDRTTRLRDGMREKLRDPVAWTGAMQIVKTVVAAVVAWVLAARVFDLPAAFLAPWSALLVVHSTVYRSFWKGVKQVAAAVVGVIVAWAVGITMGLDWFALGVMLLVALLVGQVPWLKDESTTAAATALFVLTTGAGDEERVLISRLIDTGIGVGVGVLVNAAVWPPLQDHTAARAVNGVGRHVGDLLREIAEEFGDACRPEQVAQWIERSQAVDAEVNKAWVLVRQARESGRLNPRKDSVVVRKPGEFGDLLDRTEQALAEIRSMARTLEFSISDENQWDDEFRERWTALLREVAWAIQNPDARRLGEVRTKLAALADDYSDEQLSGLHWPEYGGLILNLRNIATSMDQVADSDPLSVSSRGPLGTAAL